MERGQRFSNGGGGGQFCPPGSTWQCQEKLSQCAGREGATCIQEGDIRDIAKRPVPYTTAPTTKNDLAPNVISAQVEKHWG